MVANPALLIVSVYRPGARLRKAKWPSVLVVSVCTKLVSKFFASTVAPATLPPFSSTTSPCTVPALICDWPHPDVASPSASVKTKKAHNTFLIFSPPDITTPIRTSHGIPQEVEAARKIKLLRESLCREGLKAQEWCLWKPSILRAKFWMQCIGQRKCTHGILQCRPVGEVSALPERISTSAEAAFFRYPRKYEA